MKISSFFKIRPQSPTNTQPSPINQTQSPDDLTSSLSTLTITDSPQNLKNFITYRPLFPYRLDNFQIKAIRSLKQNVNILVTAPTSAGKTAIAIAAINQFCAKQQKVVYTSPVKALSNQKLEEFDKIFKNQVGLITGDTKKNKEANCIVVTTEVLRNRIFGAEKYQKWVKTIKCVIVDEAQYIGDSERGQVWEEMLAVLEEDVKIIFLSATISNPDEIVKWMERKNKKPCEHFNCEKRPVTIEHYVMSAGYSDRPVLIQDANGVFKRKEFVSCLSYSHAVNFRKKSSAIISMISSLVLKNIRPIICFGFNRYYVETMARSMYNLSKISSRHKEISQEFNKIRPRISNELFNSHLTKSLLPLLLRGIGIHHSGMIPIYKEIVEILFSKSYLDVLFSTETFSLGVNMPAKATVLLECEKFDGKEWRFITSAEYIQMSGRAGRRGKDKEGMSIIVVDKRTTLNNLQSILCGEEMYIRSNFKLTSVLALNLMRKDKLNIDEFFSNTLFSQQMETRQKRISNLLANNQKEMHSLLKSNGFYQKSNVSSLPLMNLMQPGRLVYINFPQTSPNINEENRIEDNKSICYGWGVLLRIFNNKKDCYQCDVCIECDLDDYDMINQSIFYKNVTDQTRRLSVKIIRFDLKAIFAVNYARLYLKNDVMAVDKQSELNRLIDVLKKLENDPHFFRNIAIVDEKKALNLVNVLIQSKTYLTENSMKIINKLNNIDLQDDLKKEKPYVISEELKKHTDVFLKLKYIDSNRLITTKGQFASFIQTGDPLLITEIVFDDKINVLPAEHLAAMTSLFIDKDKSKMNNNDKNLDGIGRGIFATVTNTARRMMELQRKMGIQVDEVRVMKKIIPTGMKLVYDWANKTSFNQICKSTDMMEGSIIKMFKRIKEVLEHICGGMKFIGMNEQAKMFDKAVKLINRGVIKSDSLYFDQIELKN